MITPSDLYEIDALVQEGQIDRTLKPAGKPEEPHVADNLLKFWTVCPWSDTLTKYDLENIYLFARLLDAENEGADIDEIARLVFRLKPQHRDRARRIVSSHLARAHWLMKNEFPFLNW